MSSISKLFVVVNHVFSNLGEDAEELLRIDRVDACCDAFAGATSSLDGCLSIPDADADPETRIRKGTEIVFDTDGREPPVPLAFCPWCAQPISGLEIREVDVAEAQVA